VESGVEFEEGKHSEERILDSDLIVKSPGIPFTTPLMKKAVDKGLAVIDELELAHHVSNGKIIAITGHKWKDDYYAFDLPSAKECWAQCGLGG